MKKKEAAEKSAAGDYAQGVGEEFDTYRNLREQGYSKDEAAEKTILTLAYSFVLEMLFDKGEKWLLNRFKVKNGGGTNGIVAKADDVIEFENFKKTIGDDFTYDLDSFKRIKYNEHEKWKIINLDYSRRADLIAHPEKALPKEIIRNENRRIL